MVNYEESREKCWTMRYSPRYTAFSVIVQLALKLSVEGRHRGPHLRTTGLVKFRVLFSKQILGNNFIFGCTTAALEASSFLIQ